MVTIRTILAAALRAAGILVAVVALFCWPAQAQLFDATRVAANQWEAAQVDGTHISWHQTQDTANEACQKWMLANGLADCVTRAPGTRWSATKALRDLIAQTPTTPAVSTDALRLDVACLPSLVGKQPPYDFDPTPCISGTAASRVVVEFDCAGYPGWQIIDNKTVRNTLTAGGGAIRLVFLVDEGIVATPMMQWSAP